MARRFRHGSQEWEVEMTGGSHGVGSGHPPPISSWGVTFECVSEPGRQAVYGHVRTSNLVELSDDDLASSLEHAFSHQR